MFYPKVTTATIVTTDRCTAQCKECCFQCSPQKMNTLSLYDIKTFISRVIENFRDVKSIAFTGGECTLLKDDLLAAISFCNSLGLRTRIVTNGWWAESMQKASLYIKKLKENGLTEINFSTGDNHQEYVPFQYIVNASKAACDSHLITVITIETFNEASFKRKNALKNQDFYDLVMSENGKYLTILDSLWIPFHENIKYTYSPCREPTRGCDSLLTYIGLFPDRTIRACCGLTLDYLDSMIIGKLDDVNIKDKYVSQFNDFLKIWIYVDGPERIYNYCLSIDKSLDRDPLLVHSCQFCAELYNNIKLRQILMETWQTVVEEVMFRYAVKVNENEASNN